MSVSFFVQTICIAQRLDGCAVEVRSVGSLEAVTRREMWLTVMMAGYAEISDWNAEISLHSIPLQQRQRRKANARMSWLISVNAKKRELRAQNLIDMYQERKLKCCYILSMLRHAIVPHESYTHTSYPLPHFLASGSPSAKLLFRL